jgi:hypothetical protein
MAITYEADGAGSDTHVFARCANATNRERRIMASECFGLVGRIQADFNETLNTESTSNEKNALAQIVNSAIIERRNAFESAQQVWIGAASQWLTTKVANDGLAFSPTAQDAFDALYADMGTNNKLFEAQSADIAEDGSPNIHVHASNLHAQESFLTNSAKMIRYATDLDTETLTARVSAAQSASSGAGRMALAGQFQAGSGGVYPDLLAGWGSLGDVSFTGWNIGGLVINNKAQAQGVGDEFSVGWRAFTASPDSNAPTTGRVVRDTDAGVPYHGTSCFKFVGNDVATSIYAAQVLNNPNLDLNTTAWGTSANARATQIITPQQEGQILFVSFYYRNLPTGYTMLPVLISNGNILENDEIVVDTVKDNSNTWRKAVFAFRVRQGMAVERLIFSVRLSRGSAIAAGATARFDVLKVEMGQRLGNFWFHATPSQTPLGRDGEETFTLTQTTRTKWETFWARYFTDRFGQAVQLPAGTATESEDLITLEDSDDPELNDCCEEEEEEEV